MNVSEVRKLGDDDLQKELNSKKNSLMRLRFEKAGGQLKDTSQLGRTKRDVARIMTVIRERQILAELTSKESD